MEEPIHPLGVLRAVVRQMMATMHHRMHGAVLIRSYARAQDLVACLCV